MTTADLLPGIPIPNDPIMIGYQLYTQVVVFDDDPSDPVKVSNALDITVHGAVIPFGIGTGFSLIPYLDPVIGGVVDVRLLGDFHFHESHPGDTDGKQL